MPPTQSCLHVLIEYKRKYSNYSKVLVQMQLAVLSLSKCCRSSSVRNPEGRIRLYCKGADTVLLERLHPSNQELVNITSDHLNVSLPGGSPQ